MAFKEGECRVCKRVRRIAFQDLCGSCYSRLRRNGTTDYVRKGTFTLCTVEGCDNRASSNGLCQKHLQRMRKHGHTDQTRPASWGLINKHPLQEQWNYLHSHKGQVKCAPEWQTDFLRFAADVGEQPSKLHRLVRPDRARPIGPDNFRWELPLVTREPGETDQEYQARSSRVHRAIKPEQYKRRELRRRFAGLELEEVQRLSKFQNHQCAICGREETAILWERVLALAVDHEHKPGGKVRGLLCLKCNRALGLLEDSETSLLAAIAYLKDPPMDRMRRILETQLQTGTANNDT